MRRNQQVLIVAALAMLVLGLVAGCKSSGMAVTTRGQVLKIDIEHPNALPEQGVDNLDIQVSNVGVNNISDILLDVELPPQLVVMDQTIDRGVNSEHQPGSNLYSFSFGKIQPGERSTVRFRVRTAFGTLRETASIKATAWQCGLPGDKLVETAVIKLQE